MSEYNFVPDYAAWWKKRDLSKKQLSWLVLGVNPHDAEKNEKIHLTGNASPEDVQWMGRFRGYTDSLLNGWWVHDNYNDLIKNVDWGKGKNDFISNCHDYALDFPAQFIDVLNSEKKPLLQKYSEYKKHDIFYVDITKADFSGIKTELDAFSMLLGLSAKYFRKMCEIEDYRNDSGTWKTMSPDSRHFSKEYYSFLKRHFPHLDLIPHKIIHQAWKKAEKLGVWKGNFIEYAQCLFDEGFIFPNTTIEIIEKQGFKRVHSKDAWAIRFYERWKREPLWSLEEALLLFKGASPIEEKRCFVDLAQIQAVYTCSSRPLFYEEFDDKYVEIIPKIKKHVASGDIEEIVIDEKLYYRPQEIVRWMLKNIPYAPPQALMEVLEIKDEHALSLSALGDKAIRDKVSRKHDFHKCIGHAWTTLKQENPPRKVSAEAVWNYLEKHKSEYECIQEFAETNGEKVVYWCSQHGNEQEMLYSTFQNEVSKYNTGKKIYPNE